MIRRLFSPLDALSFRQGLCLAGLCAWMLAIAAVPLQGWYDLSPCPLCIFQRLLFKVFGTLALVFAIFSTKWRAARKEVSLALALLCLGGFAVAVYQTLMQSAPGLVQECSYVDPGPIERFIDGLGMFWLENSPVLPMLFFASGQCSSKEWVFLGLSMANWAAFSFLVLGIFVLVKGWKKA
jgi:disulfide bond formation protein DsbB